MPKLSLEPYKGTRDFYPQDQFIQNFIFSVWRKVAESFGYMEYAASVLEETALYKAKSGEEIVNEQTYSFIDRGSRDVTIRPEMTPTVARMIAQKRKELVFPVRWFSMPNLFRYERPQRGRLREHWQLNVDIFGVDSVEADIEIIKVASEILFAFGANQDDFEIRVSNRKLLNYLLKEYLQLNEEQTYKTSKLIDRMRKITQDEFLKDAEEIVGDKAESLMEVLYVKSLDELGIKAGQVEAAKELNQLISNLERAGLKNVIFDPAIVRGFDYYTGIVFEIYDTNPLNNRALFGGGRYNDLVGIFEVEKVPGVGFGMGDVTVRDFLETHGLLPQYKSPIDLYVAHMDQEHLQFAEDFSQELRRQGLNVAVDITDKKISNQIKLADRQKASFVVVIGEEEVKTNKFKVKSLATGEEQTVDRKDIKLAIKK